MRIKVTQDVHYPFEKGRVQEYSNNAIIVVRKRTELTARTFHTLVNRKAGGEDCYCGKLLLPGVEVDSAPFIQSHSLFVSKLISFQSKGHHNVFLLLTKLSFLNCEVREFGLAVDDAQMLDTEQGLLRAWSPVHPKRCDTYSELSEQEKEHVEVHAPYCSMRYVMNTLLNIRGWRSLSTMHCRLQEWGFSEPQRYR